jgi:hypothetical protein
MFEDYALVGCMFLMAFVVLMFALVTIFAPQQKVEIRYKYTPIEKVESSNDFDIIMPLMF